MNTIERIKQREELCDQHVRGYSPTDDSDASIGRVELEITDFTSYTTKYNNPRWRVKTETPWGEVASWSYSASTFHDTWVAQLCEDLEIEYTQFESLVGESVWVNVLEVDFDQEEDTPTSNFKVNHDFLTEY